MVFLCKKMDANKYKNKKRDVGMAVPNLGVWMAVCRQNMLYKDNTSNPIPTSFFGLKNYYSQ